MNIISLTFHIHGVRIDIIISILQMRKDESEETSNMIGRS